MYFVQITQIRNWREHLLVVDSTRHFTTKQNAERYLCTQLHKEMADWGYEEMMEKLQPIDKKYFNKEKDGIDPLYLYNIEAMTEIFQPFISPDDESRIHWILDEVIVDVDCVSDTCILPKK